MRLTTEQRLARLERGRVAERERRYVERPLRAEQAEAALVIVGDDVGCDRLGPDARDRHLARLEDQIADGQDQTAVVDHSTTALALGAERRGGARIGRDQRTDLHDARERIGLGVLCPRRRGRCEPEQEDGRRGDAPGPALRAAAGIDASELVGHRWRFRAGQRRSLGASAGGLAFERQYGAHSGSDQRLRGVAWVRRRPRT